MKKNSQNKKHIDSGALVRNSSIIIAGITLALIIILGSFTVMIFNKGFYYGEYAKNNVYTKMVENGYATKENSENRTIAITENLIRYLRGKSGVESLNAFTPDEQSHLYDVARVMQALYVWYYSAITLFILSFLFLIFRVKDKNELVKYIARIVLIGSITAGVILCVIIFSAVFYFEQLFALFHLFIFPQGNWMFANNSLLITLFSQAFFFNISLRIFFYAFFQTIIFFIIGWWLRKHTKLQEKWK